MHTYAHTLTFAHTYTHTHACSHTCSVQTHAHMLACEHTYTYTRAHTHTRAHTQTHTPCSGAWHPAVRVVSLSSGNRVSGHSQCRRPVSSVMSGITLKLVYRIELLKESFRKTAHLPFSFLFSQTPTAVEGYSKVYEKVLQAKYSERAEA